MVLAGFRRIVTWTVSVVAALVVMVTAGLFLAGASTHASPQGVYPAHPIRIVVTFPPGGGTDLLARKLGAHLEQNLSVPVVVENRPGASGNIGAQAVARAQPDGYTLLMVNSSFAINPGVYSRLGFAPSTDFAAIFNAAWVPSVVITATESDINGLDDLVQQATVSPLSVATCGNGTPQHLAVRMLHEASGATFQHIPYRGCGPALTDVMSGVVPVGVVTLSSAMAHLQSGALTAQAVTASERSTLLPTVPTVAEYGYKGYVLNQWHGLLAPAGVPNSVADKLAGMLQDIVDRPSMGADLKALGYEPAQQGRADFQHMVIEDIARFGALTARMGLRVD